MRSLRIHSRLLLALSLLVLAVPQAESAGPPTPEKVGVVTGAVVGGLAGATAYVQDPANEDAAYKAFATGAPIALAVGAAAHQAWACSAAFRNLASYANAGQKLIRGKGTAQLDAESYRIFEKVRLNPGAEVSAEELALLSDKGHGPLFDLYRRSAMFTGKLNHLLAMPARSGPLQAREGMEKGRLAKVWSRAQRVFFPGLPVGTQAKLERIYGRALRSGNFELKPSDLAYLKSAGYDEDFARLAEEAKTNLTGLRTASTIRSIGNNARFSVIVAAPVVAVVAPAFQSDRITSPEELQKRVAVTKGLQLMFLGQGANDVMVKLGDQAIVFGMDPSRQIPRAKFYSKEKLVEFEKDLARDKMNYNRIAFNSTPEENKRVMAKIKEFVTRTRTRPDGGKEVDVRSYLDAPLAEVYRVLQEELGLPPAPIVKRHNDFMPAYFGALRFFQGKDGRIKDYYRARTNEDSGSAGAEAAVAALKAYQSTLMYSSIGSKMITGSALALDAYGTTRSQHVEEVEAFAKKNEEAALKNFYKDQIKRGFEGGEDNSTPEHHAKLQVVIAARPLADLPEELLLQTEELDRRTKEIRAMKESRALSDFEVKGLAGSEISLLLMAKMMGMPVAGLTADSAARLLAAKILEEEAAKSPNGKPSRSLAPDAKIGEVWQVILKKAHELKKAFEN